MNTPRYESTVTTRHEWVIGEPGRKIVARDLDDGLIHAVAQMREKFKLDLSHDDAYYAEGNEDGTISIYFEAED